MERAEGIGTSAPICIEENVWIGAGAVILGDVTIGAGSVIAAGAIVNHSIPSGVIAGGTPAEVIRKITVQDQIRSQILQD